MGSHTVKLNVSQIELINDAVDKAQISFSHLKEELIDHICCLIEEYLEVGYTFDVSFKKVFNSLNINDLKGVEFETILLISKNFRQMKTTLKISGIAGISLLLLAGIFKTFHIAGANVLLGLGFLSFLLAYIPVLAFTLYKERLAGSKRNVAILGLATAFVTLISFLFTLMHWPYTDQIIFISWMFLVVFLVRLFLNIMKTEVNRLLNLSMWMFIALLFIMDVTIFFQRINNPRLSKIVYDSSLSVTADYFNHKSIVAYAQLDSIMPKNVQIDSLKTKTKILVEKFEDLKNDLFVNQQEMENHNKMVVRNVVTNSQTEAMAMELEKEILLYKAFVLSMVLSDSGEIGLLANQLLYFGPFDYNTYAQTSYNNLSRTIRNIRLIECEILSAIKTSR